MPREIKFRAWDKRFKRMEHGSPMAILYMDDSDHEIMQYTGLKDKNGKEIYEGDILRDSKKQNGKVMWWNNSWLVEWQERDREGHLLQDKMTDDCFGYGEVIGNIYENPELLK